MAKIPLTIDPSYCSDWGAWEGVRELISNAKDAEDEDPAHAMTIQHLPRTSRLVITNAHTVVDPASLLVLGKSSKRGLGQRGRFGEGFVVGVLALTRAGHDVTFKNGDSSWKVTLERADEDHPFAGNELLTFYSRLVTPTDDFEVTVEGITTDIWSAMKKLFLFLTPPASSEMVKVSEGTLLLSPDRKGQVFAKGVFVNNFEKLQCGYDLNKLHLDRDRRMVDEWRLHDQLCDLWADALKTRPDEMSKPVYELAKSQAPEARHLTWRTDEKLLKTMKKEFEEENGEGAVPVTTTAEAKEIMSLGAKPVVVNNTLKELLAKTGVSVEATKTALEGEVSRYVDVSELAPLAAGCAHVEALTKKYVIVEFRGESTLCKPLDENKVLGVDKRLLSKPMREIWLHVVRGEARRRGTSETAVLFDAMQDMLGVSADVEAHCDECGAKEPSGPHDLVGKWHETSCSLYPSSDGASDPSL